MKKILMIIGGIMVALVLIVGGIFLFTSLTSKKLACKSSDGDITIMYNDKKLLVIPQSMLAMIEKSSKRLWIGLVLKPIWTSSSSGSRKILLTVPASGNNVVFSPA